MNTPTNQEPDSGDWLKLCPGCKKVKIMVQYDLCASCSNSGRFAPKPDESVIVDGDAYYSKNLAIIGDTLPYTILADEVSSLAKQGRINDIRRHIANFTAAKLKAAELSARIDELNITRGGDGGLHARKEEVDARIADLQQELASLKKEGE